jgi:hypothetical protein
MSVHCALPALAVHTCVALDAKYAVFPAEGYVTLRMFGFPNRVRITFEPPASHTSPPRYVRCPACPDTTTVAE